MTLTSTLVLTSFLFVAEAATGQTQQQAPFIVTPEEAREIETKNALPISKFYDTPDPLKGKPGRLLKSEEFVEYTFPIPGGLKALEMGIKTVRFLYVSESASGKIAPAS